MKRYLLLFIILVSLLSCTKQKAKTDWVAVNTQFLTAGVWNFSSYDYYGTISHTTYADLAPCRQDDQEQFSADGSGQTSEGLTKCNASDPQTANFSWRFTNENANTLEISAAGSTTVYYIDKLDAHDFKYHRKHSDPYAAEISYGYSR